MTSAPPSETELARTFVRARAGEPLPDLLQRALERVQSVRAAAYTRLRRALRRTSAASGAGAPSPPDYATICAHVTEDLKLASEAVMELRGVVAAWPTRDGAAAAREVRAAVQWLDALQSLEERKLVATVSFHALQRSAAQHADAQDAGARRERLSKFAKDLNATDLQINDLLQEVREYYLQHREESGSA